MATTQHIYTGEGDPNGVITDAAVGSHYIDNLNAQFYQVGAAAENGYPAYWVRLQIASLVEFADIVSAEYVVWPGERQVLLTQATVLVFEQANFSELYASQPLTYEDGAWRTETSGPALLKIQRTQNEGGWLAEIIPMHFGSLPV